MFFFTSFLGGFLKTFWEIFFFIEFDRRVFEPPPWGKIWFGGKKLLLKTKFLPKFGVFFDWKKQNFVNGQAPEFYKNRGVAFPGRRGGWCAHGYPPCKNCSHHGGGKKFEINTRGLTVFPPLFPPDFKGAPTPIPPFWAVGFFREKFPGFPLFKGSLNSHLGGARVTGKKGFGPPIRGPWVF